MSDYGFGGVVRKDTRAAVARAASKGTAPSNIPNKVGETSPGGNNGLNRASKKRRNFK